MNKTTTIQKCSGVAGWQNINPLKHYFFDQLFHALGTGEFTCNSKGKNSKT
jgi:hypothetical protein